MLEGAHVFIYIYFSLTAILGALLCTCNIHVHMYLLMFYNAGICPLGKLSYIHSPQNLFCPLNILLSHFITYIHIFIYKHIRTLTFIIHIRWPTQYLLTIIDHFRRQMIYHDTQMIFFFKIDIRPNIYKLQDVYNIFYQKVCFDLQSAKYFFIVILF